MLTSKQNKDFCHLHYSVFIRVEGVSLLLGACHTTRLDLERKRLPLPPYFIFSKYSKREDVLRQFTFLIQIAELGKGLTVLCRTEDQTLLQYAFKTFELNRCHRLQPGGNITDTLRFRFIGESFNVSKEGKFVLRVQKLPQQTRHPEVDFGLSAPFTARQLYSEGVGLPGLWLRFSRDVVLVNPPWDCPIKDLDAVAITSLKHSFPLLQIKGRLKSTEVVCTAGLFAQIQELSSALYPELEDELVLKELILGQNHKLKGALLKAFQTKGGLCLRLQRRGCLLWYLGEHGLMGQLQPAFNLSDATDVFLSQKAYSQLDSESLTRSVSRKFHLLDRVHSPATVELH